MRLFLVKVEIVGGAVLLTLCIGHAGWCRLSIPRYGQNSPHGLETAACNWGTELGGLVLALIALLTLASGLLGYRARSRTLGWYLAQLPAIVAWGWVAYSMINTLIIYPG